MAGRGPAPKNPAARKRTNKKQTAAVLVGNPRARVPALPQLEEPGPELDDGSHLLVTREWHPQTVLEWRAIHRSPMAPEFIDVDDAGVIKLIVLIDDFWKAGTAKERKELSVEIRLQRLEFGLTPVARSRMQWEVERGAEAVAKAAKRSKSKSSSRKPRADPREALGAQGPPSLRVVKGGRAAKPARQSA